MLPAYLVPRAVPTIATTSAMGAPMSIMELRFGFAVIAEVERPCVVTAPATGAAPGAIAILGGGALGDDPGGCCWYCGCDEGIGVKDGPVCSCAEGGITTVDDFTIGTSA